MERTLHAPRELVFEALGDETRVTLKLVFDTVEECRRSKEFGAVEGGNQTLQRLEEFLQSQLA